MANKKEKQVNLYLVTLGLYEKGEYYKDEYSFKILAETGTQAITKVKENYPIKTNEFIDEVELLEEDIIV